MLKIEWPKAPKKHGNGRTRPNSDPPEITQRRLTPERMAVFLNSLRQTGIVARAARDASPHALGPCVKTFVDRKLIDKNFSDAWDAAIEEADAAILSEMRRRAIEGWDNPVYQKGRRVKDSTTGAAASVRQYSDSLLSQLAKSKRRIEGHEFVDRAELHIDGTVKLETEGRLYLTEADLEALSSPQRVQLIEILRSIAHTRGLALTVDPHHAATIEADFAEVGTAKAIESVERQ